ncbi:MAG TPA: hypothetical protein VHB47_24360, partial [Thermoanaerobaculia bacterium]|nr:hypothetical protein [Thermoanaerobaculia bacterium]
MRPVLRCLVAEDDRDWRFRLGKDLGGLAAGVVVETAGTADEARSLLQKDSAFDLATVDISLVSDGLDEQGLTFVEDLFHDARARNTALLIVTGHATTERTRQLLRDPRRRIYDVVEKNSFDGEAFLSTARDALLHARVRQAEERAARQLQLALMFGRDTWRGSELHGPGHRRSHWADDPVPLKVADLARRGD